jgi:hypothetical protein
MFVLSKTPRQLAVGDENDVHRPRRASLLDAEEPNAELGFEGDWGIPAEQWEMLERIRLAAGQTS